MQTPEQALAALQKSHGLHALFLVADDGACLVAWHNAESKSKDSGRHLLRWIADWKSETGIAAEQQRRGYVAA